MQPTPRTVTVPPGGLYLVYFDYSRINGANGTTITASAPIRFLQGLAPSTAGLPDLSPTALASYGANFSMTCTSASAFSSTTIVLDVQLGDPPTQAIPCYAGYYPTAVVNTVTAGTDDGDSWLHASLLPNYPNNISVSVDPSGLGLGSHTGVVTASLVGSAFGLTHAIFQVNVNPFATIAAQVVVGAGLSFESYQPYPERIASPATAPRSLSLSVRPTVG